MPLSKNKNKTNLRMKFHANQTPKLKSESWKQSLFVGSIASRKVKVFFQSALEKGNAFPIFFCVTKNFHATRRLVDYSSTTACKDTQACVIRTKHKSVVIWTTDKLGYGSLQYQSYCVVV